MANEVHMMTQAGATGTQGCQNRVSKTLKARYSSISRDMDHCTERRVLVKRQRRHAETFNKLSSHTIAFMETLLNLPQCECQEAELVDSDAVSDSTDDTSSTYESLHLDSPYRHDDDLHLDSPIQQDDEETQVQVSSNSIFPQLSCRQMWMSWYHEDPQSGAQPHCALQVSDLDNDDARRQWWISKQFISKLTEVALQNDFISSKKALKKLSRRGLGSVFDRAFDVFTAESGENHCRLTPDSSCVEALKWMTQTRMNLEPPQEAARVLKDCEFPLLPCREMWWLWFIGKDLPHVVMYDSRRVMKLLYELAIKEKLVPSTDALNFMPEETLLDIFDVIFPIFVRSFKPEVQSAIRPDTLCRTVSNYIMRSKPRENQEPFVYAQVAGDFPSGTARELWRLWFHGDETSHGMPYRRTMWSRRHNYRTLTKHIMAKLEECAMDAGLVHSIAELEEMPKSALMDIFDKIFDDFVARNCPACPDSAYKMCTTLYNYMLSHRKAHHDLDVQESSIISS
ncbi:hypothetical protein AeRB84_010466 [Aphanomyces euteiches]|nr:hypothetical protein AeRB84_010466 [Aphanomyces euteiches]